MLWPLLLTSICAFLGGGFYYDISNYENGFCHHNVTCEPMMCQTFKDVDGSTYELQTFVCNFLHYHYILYFETFSCLQLIYGPQQHGLMIGSSYLNHLDMSS